MKPLVTLSGLQRASVCAASVALPKVDNVSRLAALGNAIHEVIEGQITGAHRLPEEVATAWELEGVERGRFFHLVRTFAPKIPVGARAEMSLGLFSNWLVRPIEGGRGDYPDLPDLVSAGTIDAMWSGPAGLDGDVCPDGDTLWVVDWKTGDEGNVPPPAKNWQLRAAAFMAAKWTGARRVIPAICFVEPGEGRWDIGAEIGPGELEEIGRVLSGILTDIADAVDAHRNGIGPVATVGSHCEHCPARPGCVVHIAEAKALVATSPDALAKPLTEDEARRIAGMLPGANKVLELAKQALRLYVKDHGPISLPDGKVYGPRAAGRDTYATRISYEALAREIGDVAADAAFKTSKEAMYDAVGAAHDAAGIKRKKGAAMAKVLGEIDANGGKVSRVTEVWTSYYPDGQGEAK